MPTLTPTPAPTPTPTRPSIDSDLAVSTTGLTKRFGARVVVDQVDLAIPRGSISGVVGPNGAGKTTTIRMLLGLIHPSAGSGTVLNGDLAEPQTYLHKVGALIESPAFYPQLSGRDNLLALARLGRIDVSTIARVLDPRRSPAALHGPVPQLFARHETAAGHRRRHAALT